MTKLVEFIPNFSEGRRQEVIDQISEAAQGVPGAKLINVNVEPSYNRCVHTVVGDPEAVLEAGFRMCQKAVELIASAAFTWRGDAEAVPLGSAFCGVR